MNNPNPKHHDEVDLNELCLIYMDFDIWSGQTKLQKSDLKVAAEDLPPETLANLGTKRICAPGQLKGFHRLKTKARRAILDWGRPFLGGFAVPVKKLDVIRQSLEDVEFEFEGLKQTFLTGYYQAVQGWMDENPEYSDVIQRAALSSQEVATRIGFDWHILEVVPVANPVTESRLKSKVSGLGDEMIDEIVDTASEFYSANVCGRQSISVLTKPTLQKLRDKIDGLSFLNSNLYPLVTLLDETLAGYGREARKGQIHAPFFYQVMASVLILADRSKIESYANGALSIDSYSQALDQSAASGDIVLDTSIPTPTATSQASVSQETSSVVATTQQASEQQAVEVVESNESESVSLAGNNPGKTDEEIDSVNDVEVTLGADDWADFEKSLVPNSNDAPLDSSNTFAQDNAEAFSQEDEHLPSLFI